MPSVESTNKPVGAPLVVLRRLVLRLLVFLATAEYESLWRAKIRTGHNIGLAVMKDAEAQRQLETCRGILHRWQKRLHELNAQNAQVERRAPSTFAPTPCSAERKEQ